MVAACEIELGAGPMRVAGLRWGRRGGRRVIALHGWMDNAASFARLAPLLPALDLVAVDLPGHGRSDHRPPGAAYHFVDWVPDVLAVADRLGWREFAILGHSMGAGVATLVAGAFPERVERMVLVEGFGPLSGEPGGAPERLAAALADEVRTVSGARRTFPDLDAAAEARQGRSDLDLDAARLLTERGTGPAPEGGLRFVHDPRLKARSRMRLDEAQVLAFLAAVRCPVLALRARQGWPFPDEYARPRLAALATARIVDVDGGHHVHLTHPERVAGLIAQFLGDPADEGRAPRPSDPPGG